MTPKVDLVKLLASGRFKPGDRLVETRIAEELGVSRIPVREAMARLVAQGVLVASGGWQGVWVREYKPKEIMELYELREALESKAAGLAAVRATPLRREKLNTLVDGLEHLMESGAYGSNDWSDQDRRLHDGIMTASGNQRFRLLFKSLMQESRFLFYHHPVRSRGMERHDERIRAHAARVRRQHRGIVEAICAGRSGEASAIAAEHLQAAASAAVYFATSGK